MSLWRQAVRSLQLKAGRSVAKRWNTTADLHTSIVDRILAEAGGSQSAIATAAVQGAAFLIARCGSMGQVAPMDNRTSWLTPSMRRDIFYALITAGEFVGLLDYKAGRVRVYRATETYVYGGLDDGELTYRLSLATPSKGTQTVTVSEREVIHAKHSTRPDCWWRGIAPWSAAGLSAEALAETVTLLKDESSGPRGMILPLPLDPGKDEDGDDAPLRALETTIANLDGGLAVTRTTGDGWGGGAERAPKREYRAVRLGAEHQQAAISLADNLRQEVMLACGVPIALANRGESGALREGFRQLVFTTIIPLGMQIAGELTDKLGVEVSFDFDGLSAADIAGRARAYRQLIDAGMSAEDAGRVALGADRADG